MSEKRAVLDVQAPTFLKVSCCHHPTTVERARLIEGRTLNALDVVWMVESQKPRSVEPHGGTSHATDASRHLLRSCRSSSRA